VTRLPSSWFDSVIIRWRSERFCTFSILVFGNMNELIQNQMFASNIVKNINAQISIFDQLNLFHPWFEEVIFKFLTINVVTPVCKKKIAKGIEKFHYCWIFRQIAHFYDLSSTNSIKIENRVNLIKNLRIIWVFFPKSLLFFLVFCWTDKIIWIMEIKIVLNRLISKARLIVTFAHFHIKTKWTISKILT